MATENKQAPLAAMKARYGDKGKLVDEVAALLEPREGESKAQLKTRLRSVSNGKLLRLLERGKQAGGR